MEEENLHCNLVWHAKWAQTATACWFVEEWYLFPREQKCHAHLSSLPFITSSPTQPSYMEKKHGWRGEVKRLLLEQMVRLKFCSISIPDFWLEVNMAFLNKKHNLFRTPDCFAFTLHFFLPAFIYLSYIKY